MAIVKCTSRPRIEKQIGISTPNYEFTFYTHELLSGGFLVLNSLGVNLFVSAKLCYGKWGSVTKVAVDNKCLAYLYTINVLVGCIRKRSL